MNHSQTPHSDAEVIHIPSIRPLAISPVGRQPPSRWPEYPVSNPYSHFESCGLMRISNKQIGI